MLPSHMPRALSAFQGSLTPVLCLFVLAMSSKTLSWDAMPGGSYSGVQKDHLPATETSVYMSHSMPPVKKPLLRGTFFLIAALTVVSSLLLSSSLRVSVTRTASSLYRHAILQRSEHSAAAIPGIRFRVGNRSLHEGKRLTASAEEI